MDNNSYDREKGITIVSYDPNKTWVREMNDQTVFCKRSSEKEMESIKCFSNLVKGKSISVFGEKFYFNIPRIFDWDAEQQVLSMEYCSGVNLEFILRDEKTYSYGVAILNELLSFMIENKYYWIDFAPRNVLVNGKVLTLVDFEKGFGAYDTRDYLRNHVYEEYGSFTFLEDRMYTPDDVFDVTDEEEEKIYKILEIGPKRIKAVAALLGYKDVLTRSEYLSIIKTFIVAEEPYKNGDDTVFPRVELEKVLKDKEVNPEAFVNYGRIVIDINKKKDNDFVKENKGIVLVRKDGE